MLRQAKVRVRGLVPLLMHNGQLANPLNPFSKKMKAITGKQKKTDADLEALAKLEFMGSLYLDKKGEPCIPDDVIDGFFGAAARSLKKGKESKAGISANGNFPLIYKGPRDPEKLWLDESFRDTRGCKIGMKKIMRTRPIFTVWSVEFFVSFDDEIINVTDVQDILKVGSSRAGFGDYIPKFGRFAVEEFKDLGEVKLA